LHKLAIALADVNPMKDVDGGMIFGMKGWWQIYIGQIRIDNNLGAIRGKDQTQPVLQKWNGGFTVRAANRQIVNLQY
jgi:hypothetical protein